MKQVQGSFKKLDDKNIEFVENLRSIRSKRKTENIDTERQLKDLSRITSKKFIFNVATPELNAGLANFAERNFGPTMTSVLQV